MNAAADGYLKLTATVAYSEVTGRTQIRMRGKERASFLQKFCTNDVAGLSPGRGCLAFIPNVQGKVLGFVEVFCFQDYLLLFGSPGQADAIINHLKKYVLRADVQFDNLTMDHHLFLLAGPHAPVALKSIFNCDLSAEFPSCIEAPLGDVHVAIGSTRYVHPMGFWLSVPESGDVQLRQALSATCGDDVGPDVINCLRIESGTAEYGIDVTAETLPQELGMDAQAISFNKGCYLGQETIARIDAMGHVNKHLVGIQFQSGQKPAPGAEIQADGKTIGRITSSVMSRGLGKPLALAYVRRGFQNAGTRVQCGEAAGEVVHLPLGTT